MAKNTSNQTAQAGERLVGARGNFGEIEELTSETSAKAERKSGGMMHRPGHIGEDELVLPISGKVKAVRPSVGKKPAAKKPKAKK